MDDQKILDLYWSRSEKAISVTAEKYGRYCYYIAHNILQNGEDSEECVNDTYLRAWNAIPPKRPGKLSAFLGKITRNLSLNRYEKRMAEKRGGGQIPFILDELLECIPSNNNTEQIAEDIIIRNTINRYLSALPAENRKIFVQRYWYLCSIKEISSNFGIGESKVKMILFRSRNELKNLLEKEGIVL